MPKVSVLMPVYNTKEEYLREAIESILNQTFTDFEFLILDDGSDNQDTLDVLSDYSHKDQRIKLIKGEHKGIGAARNRLLKAATGDFLAIMDSDDISLPTRLEKQLLFFENNKNISICGTYFECFPIASLCKQKLTLNYLDFLREMSVGNPTVMFRKEIINQYNLSYDEELSTSEDYEFFSQAIRYVKIANIPEVLLKYRILATSNSHENIEKLKRNDNIIKQNMLDFLTDDKELQQKIMNLVCPPPVQPMLQKLKYLFWQRLFSLKNHNRHKYLCILGIKIKFKRKFNYHVVRLMGGLGNQMFQYAFGLALKTKTGKKVFFDTSWFDEAKKAGKEFANGVAVRKYELDLFNKNIPIATTKYLSHCGNCLTENNAFVFDENLFKQPTATYFDGYFQNEKYFKNIKKEIKKEFTFPQIEESDDFNQNWLRKINECENPVFVHLRRGDYLNLQGWALTTEYYKKAIQYIKGHVKNPTFFVFGQDCEDYIKNELLSHPELVSESLKFEIIGEKNSQNKDDWKDIALMMHCKHAIIANSTFSWWAAWLGRANENGIVVAPTPFINGQDEIICDNWVKIERE